MGRIKLTPSEIGTILLHDSVDVTDPCYDRDVWCRLNDVKIVPGEYTCIKYEHTSHYTHEGKTYPDTRVFKSGIYLNGNVPMHECFSQIGEIGVDAGLAGFFPEKKNFSKHEWSEFCEKIESGNAWLIEGGFCTSSGFGDGWYPVYAAKDESGRAVAIEILFKLERLKS